MALKQKHETEKLMAENKAWVQPAKVDLGILKKTTNIFPPSIFLSSKRFWSL